MTGAATPPTEGVVGTFEVCASTEEIHTFRQSLGVPLARTEMPFTYPMRWLAAPEVRGAILKAIGIEHGPVQHDDPGRVLVHLDQKFTYHVPLNAEEAYTMRLWLSPLHQAETVTLRAEILSGGHLCCSLMGRFALVAWPDRAMSSNALSAGVP